MTERDYFQIVQLAPKDVKHFSALVAAFKIVFEEVDDEIPGDAYLTSLLHNPGFIAVAILYKNRVIGGLTGYELKKYSSEGSEFLIYDVGILPEFQRKGLGNRLMEVIQDICETKNIRSCYVGAHRSDEHALEFYKSLGGEAEEVVHFSFGR